MAEVPAFDRWFRAVNPGRGPLPWQSRLARLVASSGWPGDIGVPTGLGKTACIDVAVWAMAAEADRAPSERRQPRRIWYVVNRRLLVDAALARAERIAKLLEEAELGRTDGHDPEAVAAVAVRLRDLGALAVDGGPLHVSRLRGGAELGQRPPDPAHPAIVLATVPMFGSRWLFRGYGTSAGMRPVDAALAGCDSLVLLDEAHLARPLRQLDGPAAACDPGRNRHIVPAARSGVRFVGLTATGDATSDRFDLDDEDRAHPVVQRRLHAAKAVRLAEATTVKKLPTAIAAEVKTWLDVAQEPRACLVFVNRPAVAREVHDLIHTACAAAGRDADVVLLTGRMREHEADAVRRHVLDPDTGAPADRAIDQPRALALVIVATQTLEVGADLDVDHLVTETAGARALTQRLGRLNRLGDRPWATGVLVHAADGDGGLYGAEVAAVWERLRAAAGPAACLDLSPAVIAERVGPTADQLPPPPELLPGLLWEWVKTTVAPVGEAPVELFVEGREEQRRRLQVCWRAVLDPYLPDAAAAPRLEPAVTASEAIELPVHELVTQLGELGELTVARLRADQASLESVAPSALRSGDTVVLAADAGHCDRFGWDRSSTDPVLDVSLLDAGLLPLDPHAIMNLLDESDERRQILRLVRVLTASDDDDAAEITADPDDTEPEDQPPDGTVTRLLRLLRDAAPNRMIDEERWRAFVAGLADTITLGTAGTAQLRRKPRPRKPGTAPVRADAFEELSFESDIDPTSRLLALHLDSVGATAERIAGAIGLSAEMVEACRAGGAFHDLGKYDLRFQRWLSPESAPPAPLAKSGTALAQVDRTRAAAGWPRGGRHEVLSLRLARQWYDDHPAPGVDTDLVLHLVVSHHGHGRPSLPPCDDPLPMSCTAPMEGGAVTVSADLSVIDWDQPARFRRLCERYGYWTLALLEAVVRQADQAVSSVVAS